MELNYDVIRQEIVERWGKGAQTNNPTYYMQPGAMVCLLGAANKTAGITEYVPNSCYDGEIAVEFSDAVAPVVMEMFADRVDLDDSDDNADIVWKFNDNEDTTKEDVLAVIDEVIRRKSTVEFTIPQQIGALDPKVLVTAN